MQAYFARVLLSAVVALCVVTAQAETVRVTADRVNLRAMPDLNSEVVAQVDSGDELTAHSRSDGWIEVTAPEHASVWVYGELISDGVVTVSRLNMRGGPGINYRPLGQISRGTKVTVREKLGEWLQIVPPPEARLWISVDYVEPVAVPEPEPEPKPEPEPDVPVTTTPDPPAPPVVIAPPPAPPAPPAPPEPPVAQTPPEPPEPKTPPVPPEPRTTVAVPARPMLLSVEQGVAVEMRGYLLRVTPQWMVWAVPRYRLIGRDELNRSQTLCHLEGRQDRFEEYAGRNVIVSGRQYWFQGDRAPTVIVEQIVPSSR